MIRKLLLVILFSASMCSLAEPMNYLYWDMGASPKRDNYQAELLKTLLEKTRAEYGDYKLTRVKQKFTSMRASREIGRGEIINIEATPHPASKLKAFAGAHDAIIGIDVPLLSGLLGYRKLVIRRSDQEKFARVKTAEDLRQLVAGQGKGWEDIVIYKANGYPVEDNADFEALLPMLVSHRFDYLPLSVIEVDSVIKQFGKYDSEVMIAPNLIIYYPFPVVFNVSAHYPTLAERVKKGLAIAQADGSMEKLFESYFADELIKLKAGNPQAFTLTNPDIPASMGIALPKLLNN